MIDRLVESKIFRMWTYFILLLLCFLALCWKSNAIMASIADLIRALDGR